MEMSTSRIKSIITGAVIGEALGRPFNGLSKGHMQSHLKEISGYTDPAPLLKGKMDKWTKPGLYSATIQLMIIAALSKRRNKFDKKLFIETVKEGLSKGAGDFGIFRTTSSMESSFFKSLSDADDNGLPVMQKSCRFCTIIPPLSFSNTTLRDTIMTVISFLSVFNADIESIVTALSLCHGLADIARSPHPSANNLIQDIQRSNDELADEIKKNEADIFNLCINPVDLQKACDKLNDMINEISGITDLSHAENTICHRLNASLKTPITRATVDMPFALYPYALSFYQINHSLSANIFHRILLEGGSTSCLSSITGILSGLYYGDESFSDVFVNNLINKKNMYTIINDISEDRLTKNICTEFINSESGLTIKENEERSARLKHVKQKPEKKKKQKNEGDLNKHVVESWTKIDKARWKKERKKRNNI